MVAFCCRIEILIPQLQQSTRLRIELQLEFLFSILALTSFLMDLMICSSVLTCPKWTIAFLCSQMWYTTAQGAILLTVDLIPFPVKVEQPHSIKSSQEANAIMFSGMSFPVCQLRCFKIHEIALRFVCFLFCSCCITSFKFYLLLYGRNVCWVFWVQKQLFISLIK